MPKNNMDSQEQQGQEDLPKLSPAEFQTYNAMAERMELFVRYGLKSTHINQPTNQPIVYMLRVYE